MLVEIRRAVDMSDASLLRRAAHTLKGSAAIFGAQPVLDAALRLEMMGRENNFALVAQGLELLESRTARLVKVVEATHATATAKTDGSHAALCKNCDPPMSGSG